MLSGALQWLRKSRVHAIYLELNPLALEQQGHSASTTFVTLFDLGFQLESMWKNGTLVPVADLEPSELVEACGNQCDLLFTRA